MLLALESRPLFADTHGETKSKSQIMWPTLCSGLSLSPFSRLSKMSVLSKFDFVHGSHPTNTTRLFDPKGASKIKPPFCPPIPTTVLMLEDQGSSLSRIIKTVIYIPDHNRSILSYRRRAWWKKKVVKNRTSHTQHKRQPFLR